MNGIPNTAMPQWQHMFSKDDADGMVDWLMNWKDNTNFKLNLEEIKGTWTKLADRDELAKNIQIQLIQNQFLTLHLQRRDASLVDFIDSTTGKVLSRHKTGFAVHVTVTNKKKIQDMHTRFLDLED